jgi:hypothetical protein
MDNEVVVQLDADKALVVGIFIGNVLQHFETLVKPNTKPYADIKRIVLHADRTLSLEQLKLFNEQFPEAYSSWFNRGNHY